MYGQLTQPYGAPIVNPVSSQGGNIWELQFGARNVDRKDFFSKSDPILILSASNNPQKHANRMNFFAYKTGKALRRSKAGPGRSANWTMIHQTETKPDTSNPVWAPFQVDLNRLCAGDLNRPILLEVYDVDPGKYQFIGKTITSIALLQQQRELPLMNVHRIGLNNKAGTLYVVKMEPLIKALPPQPQMVQYVQQTPPMVVQHTQYVPMMGPPMPMAPPMPAPMPSAPVPYASPVPYGAPAPMPSNMIGAWGGYGAPPAPMPDAHYNPYGYPGY